VFRPSLIRLLCLTTALFSAGLAMAAEQPVLLNANQLTYDDKAQTVTASGDVTFSQQGQIVRADRMSYNRNTDVVTAEGNVRIWQTDGSIITASYAELSRDLKQAFIERSTLLLSDNSRFIAMEGERTEGRYVRMNRALYTACEPCKHNRAKPPLWQVRAERIVHDNQRKDVIYRNATLELGGVPVFYSPYLSHPDPSVKRRSGFLAPVLGSRPNLGFVARTYYYFDVGPSQDATLETSYSSDRGLLLGGEWRQQTRHGSLQLNASATIDDIPNDDGVSPPDTDQLRGHVFAKAEHHFTENWRGNVDLRLVSDDTYLDLWKYSDEDVLASRATLEHFTPRSYGTINLASFQDLRPNITSAEPRVMQLAWQTQGAPRSALGGRWFLGAENRSVTRSSGTDSNRTSLAVGWRREDVLPAGVVLVAEANARADGFVATNLNGDDPARFRPFVQGQLTASWPLVKVGQTGQQFIEPIAQLTAAPRRPRNEPDLPNEDSTGLEFDTTNLFRGNRYAGFDRVDGGQRVAYGMRTGWTGNSGASVSATIGQSYDFSEDPAFAPGTGLEEQRSDYVGNVNIAMPDVADLAYSFRLDEKSFDPREHDLRAVVGPDWLQGSVSYLYINQATTSGTGDSLREELGLGARYRFADFWSASANHRRDLRRSDGAITSGVSLTYQDECLTFSLIGQRDHIARTGLSSGDSVFFRLTFKNLGEFQSPSISPDFLGGSSSK
jgi:LPS-assembly protein